MAAVATERVASGVLLGGLNIRDFYVSSKTVDFICSTDRFAVEFILLRVPLKPKQTVPS